ncbi:MAG: hypothetical protein NVSMB9_16090 [Isosphaeraceae bacterium]
MSSSDPIDPREGGTNTNASQRRADAAPGPGQNSRWGAWVVLPAAITAGIIAWLVGETELVRVRPRLVAMVVQGARMNASTIETELAANTATAARVYGVLGAALGLSLGIAGSLTRRSSVQVQAWVPALLGAGLGAAAGFATSLAGIPFFERHRDALENDLIPSVLLHGSIWGAIGAAAGFAFGVGTGGRQRLALRCLLGGLVGVLIGTALSDVLGAVFFPNDQTGNPVSLSRSSRFLSRLLVSLSTAVGVLVSVHERPRAENTRPPVEA